MGIILFLVDTSASMNQKTYLGTSYLDVAKVAIETFMKVRCGEVELPLCVQVRKSHIPVLPHKLSAPLYCLYTMYPHTICSHLIICTVHAVPNEGSCQ